MSESALTLQAPAKINLHLRILSRREDGFHEVRTRMCPLALCDEVTLTAGRPGKIVLTSSDTSIPCDESNLAIKALRAFEFATGIRRGWVIHLEKHIPHGAGLGGGSSDAAAVLRGLNELCSHPLDAAGLSGLAAGLGSDVPFFLQNSVCDASGRGESLQPVVFPWHLPLVLIKPDFGIPTPWAYSRWAESKELNGVLYAPQICPWGEMVNDLERPVFEKWLLLPTLKTWLLDQPEAHAALMSGSGSTIYAVARSSADASVLRDKARDLVGEDAWVAVTETVASPV